MVKNFTLTYLYGNFDESELKFNELNEYDLSEFDSIFTFIEKNTKKIPERIVNNVIDFARNYS
ncbi:MAG: hypothetical protein PF485_07280 [Bacteroidales bacterium]|jgi:hypothetical protein|nr:hypothetical protein [Bacteroidales bacterium]